MVARGGSRQAEQAADELVERELFMFVHQDPETRDGLRGIPQRLPSSPEALGSPVPGGAAFGLRTQCGRGSKMVPASTSDPEVRRVVGADYRSRYQTQEERRRPESALAAKGVA